MSRQGPVGELLPFSQGRPEQWHLPGVSAVARLRHGDLEDQGTPRVLLFREKGGEQREISVHPDFDRWLWGVTRNVVERQFRVSGSTRGDRSCQTPSKP